MSSDSSSSLSSLSSSSNSSSSASSDSLSSEELNPQVASACTGRWLQITPYLQKPRRVNGLKGFKLRIEISDWCNMEPEIFRYFRQDGEDIFTGVCSWADIEKWPTLTPRLTDTPPTFRLAYFEIIVPTELVAATMIEKITDEVNALVAAAGVNDLIDNSITRLASSA